MTNDAFPEKLIAALGTAALAAVFAVWCAHSSYSAAGYAAAVLSAGLMLALCLRFVSPLCAFVRKAAPETLESADGSLCAKIFSLMLIWDAGILVLGYVLRAALGYDESVGGYISFWLCTDSQHYMDIARDWYLSEGEWDRLVQLVFLPGYPVAVRLVSNFVGNELAAGLFVSALCFAGSGVMLYKLLCALRCGVFLRRPDVGEPVCAVHPVEPVSHPARQAHLRQSRGRIRGLHALAGAAARRAAAP